MSGHAPNFLHPSPRSFRWWALADFISMILIMITGGLVRLTGSGLGCPDWPQCYRHTTAHEWGIHSIVEFGNRLVTGLLIVVTLVAFIMAITRRPRRRDLIVTSGTLVLFVVLNAVLGAVVVYSHLNPWLVNFHMLVSLAMVVLGAVQYHRSKYLYGPGTRVELRSPRLRFVARWLAVNLAIVLIVGTATTGSGPHAGNTVGQDVARRLPFALIDVAWVHSLFAVIFIGTVLGLFLYLYQTDAAVKLQRGLRRLLLIGGLQGIVGFVQYALHLPVWLVELHIILATSLTIGVTQFTLAQRGRDREVGIVPSRS